MSLFHTTPHFLAHRDGQTLILDKFTARTMATGKLTDGAFSLTELILPEGFATQFHIHLAEDEALYVLEGQLSVLCNGFAVPASAGALIFLPHGVPHGLRVLGHASATVLCLAVPAGLEGLMIELDALQDPPHNAASDADPLRELAARYSIEVLGPLPPQKGEPPP